VLLDFNVAARNLGFTICGSYIEHVWPPPAYRHTRTELTKNSFHVFLLSTFIFKEIDLPTTHGFLLFKPTIAKCIVDSFVVKHLPW